MDAELREYLDGRFEAIGQRFQAMDQRLEAIGQRLEAIDQRFEAIGQRFQAIDQRLEAMDRRITEVEERLDAKIERVETNLLTAFHKWASPMESRMRSYKAALRALDDEVESQADRLKKLEDDAA